MMGWPRNLKMCICVVSLCLFLSSVVRILLCETVQKRINAKNVKVSPFPIKVLQHLSFFQQPQRVPQVNKMAPTTTRGRHFWGVRRTRWQNVRSHLQPTVRRHAGPLLAPPCTTSSTGSPCWCCCRWRWPRGSWKSSPTSLSSLSTSSRARTRPTCSRSSPSRSQTPSSRLAKSKGSVFACTFEEKKKD